MEHLNRDFSFRKFLPIAFYFAMQNLLTSSLNFVDTIMVGQLGETAIGAVTISNSYYTLFNLIMYGVASGISVMVAQYVGHGDRKSIHQILGLGIICGLVLSAVFTIPAILGADIIMKSFTPDSAVATLGADYLRTVIPSYVLISISQCYYVILRNMNKARVVLCLAISAIAMNTVLNYLLIYGKFGFPVLGVHGAALATDIARIYELLIVLLYVRIKKISPIFDIKSLMGFSAAQVKLYFKITLPVIANQVFWTSSMVARTYIFAQISVSALAAMNIAQTLDQIVSSVFFGATYALEIVIGNFIGESNTNTAQKTGMLFLKRTPIIGVAVAILIVIFGRFTVLLFNITPEAADLVIGMILVVGVTMPIRIPLIFLSGIMRSGGKTMIVTAIDSGFAWGIGVSITLILGIVLHLSPIIAYWGIVLDYIPRFFLQLKFFISYKWILNITEKLD